MGFYQPFSMKASFPPMSPKLLENSRLPCSQPSACAPHTLPPGQKTGRGTTGKEAQPGVSSSGQAWWRQKGVLRGWG